MLDSQESSLCSGEEEDEVEERGEVEEERGEVKEEVGETDVHVKVEETREIPQTGERFWKVKPGKRERDAMKEMKEMKDLAYWRRLEENEKPEVEEKKFQPSQEEIPRKSKPGKRERFATKMMKWDNTVSQIEQKYKYLDRAKKRVDLLKKLKEKGNTGKVKDVTETEKMREIAKEEKTDKVEGEKEEEVAEETVKVEEKKDVTKVEGKKEEETILQRRGTKLGRRERHALKMSELEFALHSDGKVGGDQMIELHLDDGIVHIRHEAMMREMASLAYLKRKVHLCLDNGVMYMHKKTLSWQ